jgi:hypothetical protein
MQNMSMGIEIRRAIDPEEMAFGEHGCAVCLVPFQVDAALVTVATPEAPLVLSPLCPSCIEHLGQRNPEHYPTIEEYEELKARYPEPIFDYEPPCEVCRPLYEHGAIIVRETLTTRDPA